MESGANEKTKRKKKGQGRAATQNKITPDNGLLFCFLRSDCRATVRLRRLRRRLCASRILKYVASAARQADVRLYDSECSFAVLPTRLRRADVSSELCATQSPVETWSGGRRRAPGESDVDSRADRGHSV